ncbi:RtcB family protein [Armatimonas sp.]|uniref:RtcB family protein n=1 Tax=Armatimonas sp. TaxID=1872638 RepID=UPI003753CB1D
MKDDPRLTRLDAFRVRIDNPQGIPTTLFASDEVPVEANAVMELLELLTLQESVEAFAEALPESFDETPYIEQVAVTPDFHKARGVPVGTVLATRGFIVPQAIGSDINCGMRLHVTGLDAETILSKREELDTTFRHLFFEGGRNIPLTGNQRRALFMEGITGLLNTVPKSQTNGTWAHFHDLSIAAELGRIDHHGSPKAERVFALDDFIGQSDTLSRDNQIGSIGGGNHFVEIQRVEKILDGATAHAWGIKPGMVTVMVHTGSVGIGHLCGNYYRDVLRSLYPSSLKHPDNGIFPLPLASPEAALFWDAFHNAANFAFANRMFLALIALRGLHQVCGESSSSLLYDAPHNYLWREKNGQILHRKGACPARGYEAMADTEFAYTGEPVLVPGSMGTSSFILAGRGNPESLNSASHGAGRALSRGDALHGHEAEFQAFLTRFRIVTPTDLRRQDVKSRRDIVEKKLDEIRQEAPYAFKGIGPIIETLHGAQIAQPVAELTPLMTIKG